MKPHPARPVPATCPFREKSPLDVITGATGLLGSHIAEQLRAAGRAVRAVVRPRSHLAFLQQLGVDCVPGDLGDLASLRSAFAGAEVVYHAAAKVGDWGTRAEFERDTLAGTHNVVAACMAARVGRLVHISSTSAYGHPPSGLPEVDESYPLGSHFWMWDDYTRTKVRAEELVWDAIRGGLPATIIRPSWLYGPRDRLSVGRIERTLRLGRAVLIGRGNNRMNTVYAGNVAEACRLAATHPAAVGEAFNITSDGDLTQREYFQLWAKVFGYKPPTRSVPFRVAFAGAWLLEAACRLAGTRKPPFITRYAVWLLGRDTYYSTAKARRLLGWQPTVGYAEGFQRTVAWWRNAGENAAVSRS